jgi:hypothetical protein
VRTLLALPRACADVWRCCPRLRLNAEALVCSNNGRGIKTKTTSGWPATMTPDTISRLSGESLLSADATAAKGAPEGVFGLSVHVGWCNAGVGYGWRAAGGGWQVLSGA